VKHLLVTNDFPPKIGGIQSLLWEWWRRLPPESFAVLTSPYAGTAEFDAGEPYRIERTREPVLLPPPWMVNQVNRLASDFGADFVVLDPAVPLGLIGPSLDLPYHLVLHGAEVTVPGRLPGAKQALAYTLTRARGIIAAGGYPAAEGEHAAGRSLPITVVPCGVDPDKFHPLDAAERVMQRPVVVEGGRRRRVATLRRERIALDGPEDVGVAIDRPARQGEGRRHGRGIGTLAGRVGIGGHERRSLLAMGRWWGRMRAGAARGTARNPTSGCRSSIMFRRRRGRRA